MMTPAAHPCPDPWSFLVCGADPDPPRHPCSWPNCRTVSVHGSCPAGPLCAEDWVRFAVLCFPGALALCCLRGLFPKETHFSLIREGAEAVQGPCNLADFSLGATASFSALPHHRQQPCLMILFSIPDKPLSNMKILTLGKLSQNKDEVKATIEKLGGKLTGTANKASLCISTKSKSHWPENQGDPVCLS